MKVKYLIKSLLCINCMLCFSTCKKYKTTTIQGKVNNLAIQKGIPNALVVLTAYQVGKKELPDKAKIELQGKSQGGAFPLRTFGSAYYQTYGGGIDGFFARFNQNDSLIHCTFIGGNGEEHVSSVVVDGNNNVLLSGNTFSTNFPCVSPTNAYTDSIRGGTYDDFICKLSPLGDLVWSAYIGGSGDEYLYGIQTGSRIALDTANNIYLVGTTLSNDFPLYNSTGFNDHTFSSMDGYIMKFAAANMDTLWSSYFSEVGKTELISIAIDSKNWKYIGGGTNDVSLVTTPQNSAYNQNSIIGITDIDPQADAFLLVINSNEDIIYSTYFGGKTSQTFIFDNELIYDLNVSGDQLYFVGRTNSDDSTITLPTYNPGNGAYFEPYFMGGTSDAFISTICIDLIDGIYDVAGENASNNIIVYPNPANNTLNIKLTADEKLESLELVNVSGEIIKQISKSNITNRSFSINVENIPNGIYLVKVNYVDKIISTKFIKQ